MRKRTNDEKETVRSDLLIRFSVGCLFGTHLPREDRDGSTRSCFPKRSVLVQERSCWFGCSCGVGDMHRYGQERCANVPVLGPLKIVSHGQAHCWSSTKCPIRSTASPLTGTLARIVAATHTLMLGRPPVCTLLFCALSTRVSLLFLSR